MRIYEVPGRSIIECVQTHVSIEAEWPGGVVLLVGDERPRLSVEASTLTRWAILAERVTDADVELVRAALHAGRNIVPIAKAIGRLRAALFEAAAAALEFKHMTHGL